MVRGIPGIGERVKVRLRGVLGPGRGMWVMGECARLGTNPFVNTSDAQDIAR